MWEGYNSVKPRKGEVTDRKNLEVGKQDVQELDKGWCNQRVKNNKRGGATRGQRQMIEIEGLINYVKC